MAASDGSPFSGPALTLVITAGNYDQRDHGAAPERVITDVILPNVR